jgi:hypothetical protein
MHLIYHFSFELPVLLVSLSPPPSNNNQSPNFSGGGGGRRKRDVMVRGYRTQINNEYCPPGMTLQFQPSLSRVLIQ